MSHGCDMLNINCGAHFEAFGKIGLMPALLFSATLQSYYIPYFTDIREHMLQLTSGRGNPNPNPKPV